MPTVLITGAGGQMGQELLAWHKSFPSLTLLPADHATIDITHPRSIRHFLDNHPVDYWINCAAYTNVDQAEKEPEAAHQVNVQGAINVARACQDRHIPLIHLSTDYVYHNSINRPLRETDITRPQGVYAHTKYEGEQRSKAVHPDTLILRTSWLYSIYGHNFVKSMLRLGKEREELAVVFDQVGAPTYARDLARALLDIIHQRAEGKVDSQSWSNIYHYANEGVASWYDFALAVFERCGIHCTVHPILSKDFPTPARRPTYSLLDKSKIKETFNLSIPHWRDSLQDCLERMATEERKTGRRKKG